MEKIVARHRGYNIQYNVDNGFYCDTLNCGYCDIIEELIDEMDDYLEENEFWPGRDPKIANA